MNKLKANNLRFGWRNRLVLDGISFELVSGNWLHISGENGVGKTTLLNLLASFRQPDEGQLYWNKSSVHDRPESYRGNVFFVGHQEALFEKLTVRDNLHLFEGLFGFQHSGSNELLYSIPHAEKVQNLSRGQKLRVQLGCVLETDRTVILLDEPMVGLDKEGKDNLRKGLERLRDNNRIIVSASSNPLEGPNRKGTLRKDSLEVVP